MSDLDKTFDINLPIKGTLHDGKLLVLAEDAQFILDKVSKEYLKQNIEVLSLREQLAQTKNQLKIEQECYEKNAADSLDLLAECGAELDRDADLVLSQSARRMTELEVKLQKVTADLEQLKKWQTGVYSPAAYMAFSENSDNVNMSEVRAMLAKRDLEQQKIGSASIMSIATLNIQEGRWEIYCDAVNSLISKQANEVGK